MKKCLIAAAITLTSLSSFAGTDCDIKMVLDAQSFYHNTFQNIQDGFQFNLRSYSFFYRTDPSKNTKSVQIVNQRTSESYISSAALDSRNTLNTFVIENGRVMAEMTCRFKADNVGPVTPPQPVDSPDIFPFN